MWLNNDLTFFCWISVKLFTFLFFSCLGNYLYIEASSKKYSDNAVLLSPLIPPTGLSGYCFTFWYHMFGPHIGVLSVYSMIGGRKILQFTKGGTQGNKWNQAVINVNSTTDFKVWLTCYTALSYRFLVFLVLWIKKDLKFWVKFSSNKLRLVGLTDVLSRFKLYCVLFPDTS